VGPSSANLCIEFANKRLPGIQVGVAHRVGELSVHKVKSINIGLAWGGAAHELLRANLCFKFINLGARAVFTGGLGGHHHRGLLSFGALGTITLWLNFTTGLNSRFCLFLGKLGKILFRKLDLTVIVKFNLGLLLL
jgi:hypothetical protein